MELFTRIDIPEADFKIDYNSRIVFIGSCFADNISKKFSERKFHTFVNPFGTLYNPLSIENMVQKIADADECDDNDCNEKCECGEKCDCERGDSRDSSGECDNSGGECGLRSGDCGDSGNECDHDSGDDSGDSSRRCGCTPRGIYTEKDIFFDGCSWSSWDAHSSLSVRGTGKDANARTECVSKLNRAISESQKFLKNADTVFITLGTAFVYFLKTTGKVVSNCHKMPAEYFERCLISVEDAATALSHTVKNLQKIKSDIRIIFTVSPLRHLSDGAHGNNLSKSTLLLAVEKVCREFAQVRRDETVECSDTTDADRSCAATSNSSNTAALNRDNAARPSGNFATSNRDCATLNSSSSARPNRGISAALNRDSSARPNSSIATSSSNTAALNCDDKASRSRNAETSHSSVTYFPSYEIVLDELRDYRFYAEDMVHLSATAEDYIFEKMYTAYCSKSTIANMKRVEKFMRTFSHKIIDASSAKTKALAKQQITEAKHLETQIKGLDLSAEIEHYSNLQID